MIRYSLLQIVLLIACLNVLGQKMPEDYMYEAHIEQAKENYPAALANLKYVPEHYPTSKYCPAAYYNIGTINAYTTKDTGIAVSALRKAISGAAAWPDERSTVSAYANMSRACSLLSKLYEGKGNYDSALYFLYLYDTGGYAKMYGCSGEAKAVEEHTIARYAEIYIKANHITDAENVLLSRHIFKWRSYYGEVDKQLKMLFNKHEQPAILKHEIETAVDNYFLDSTYYNDKYRHDTVIYDCIHFHGAKVRLYYRGSIFEDTDDDPIPDLAELPEKEKMIARLKKSELYTLIEEL